MSNETVLILALVFVAAATIGNNAYQNYESRKLLLEWSRQLFGFKAPEIASKEIDAELNRVSLERERMFLENDRRRELRSSGVDGPAADEITKREFGTVGKTAGGPGE